MKPSLKLCDCVLCGGPLPAQFCIRESQEHHLREQQRHLRKSKFYGVLAIVLLIILGILSFFSP